MMEPLAVGWHAVKKANFKPGDSALILGAGPVSVIRLPLTSSTDDEFVRSASSS